MIISGLQTVLIGVRSILKGSPLFLLLPLLWADGAWATDHNVCISPTLTKIIVLKTQADVDAFKDCDYTSIAASLRLGNDLYDENPSDITNLDGLADIKAISGDLRIYNAPALTNLDGLADLNTIGRTSPDRYLDIQKTGLTNLDGLSNLTSVSGYLKIKDNPALININGLSNLTLVNDEVSIILNPALTNIDGLANINRVGGLIIETNVALTNIDAVSNLTSVGGNLVIKLNDRLTDLGGLANINNVQGYVEIAANAAVTNLDGLGNLTLIEGEYLSIKFHDSLTNIDGLANLERLYGGLNISYNKALTNLDGLANLISIGGRYGGGMTIANDDVLADCQGLGKVLGAPNGSPNITGKIKFMNNATGCNSVEEVLASIVSAPAKPSIISTKSGDGQITLSVSASNNGGANVTRYAASCTDGTNTYTGASSTSTVTGLTNGVAYTCTATASNSAGTSPASSATDPITPASNSSNSCDTHGTSGAYVQKIYIAYLGRPPAPSGLEYYANFLDADNEGGKLILFDDLYYSAEAKALYNTMTLAEQINQFYQFMFNRDALSDGLNYWIDQINGGFFTIPASAAQIADAASGEGMAKLDAKQVAASKLTCAIGDDAAKLSAFQANAAGARASIAAVTTAEQAAAYDGETELANITGPIGSIGSTSAEPSNVREDHQGAQPIPSLPMLGFLILSALLGLFGVQRSANLK